MAAFATEFEPRRVAKTAVRANHLKLASAFHTELGTIRIFKLALWALHFCSCRRADGGEGLTDVQCNNPAFLTVNGSFHPAIGERILRELVMKNLLNGG